MKIMIFGSSGFVGSNITRYFIDNEEEVHAFLRKDSNTWRINDLKENLIIHNGDLGSKNDIESVISSVKPDVVINCSGIVAGFEIIDQDEVIQKNLINTVNLVNTCLKFNIDQLINTGSSYECGFSDSSISGNKCSNNPTGLYGITKKAEREYIDMIAKKFERDYTTLRLFTTFGFFDQPIRLIPYIILSLIHNEIPHINNPLSGRDFIFIKDVCKVYYTITKKPDLVTTGEVLNLGTGKMTRVMELVKYLSSFTNFDNAKLQINESNYANYLYADQNDINRTLSKLNVTLTPLTEGLRKTYDWFIQNKNFYPFSVNKN